MALSFIAAAVVLGALGAHALQNVLSPSALDSFDTAVRYQLTMSLGAVLLILLQAQFRIALRAAIVLVLIGTVFFSGSIYGLTALQPGSGLRAVLGPVTPVGGVLMIVGWTWAVIRVASKKTE